MGRLDWDRVTREDRYAAARRHEERMAEEAAPFGGVSLDRNSRAEDPRPDYVVTAKWWRPAGPRWRGMRRTLRSLLEAGAELWIVGTAPDMHMFLAPGNPAVVRVSGASVQVEGADFRLADDSLAGRQWCDAHIRSAHAAAAVAVSVMRSHWHLDAAHRMRMSVITDWFTYEQLLDCFSEPARHQRARNRRR